MRASESRKMPGSTVEWGALEGGVQGPHSSECGLRTSSRQLPGNMTEMHTFRPQPDLRAQNLRFNQIPGVWEPSQAWGACCRLREASYVVP